MPKMCAVSVKFILKNIRPSGPLLIWKSTEQTNFYLNIFFISNWMQSAFISRWSVTVLENWAT